MVSSGDEAPDMARCTFVIDEQGKVTHVFPKVSPKTHDEEVLAALAE